MRERDFARIHSIAEAELVAAYTGISAVRLVPDVEALLNGLTGCGEVMALTRNESAVHEKIGPYEKVNFGKHATTVLGEQIDLRVFPTRWAFGFAVEKTATDGAVRRSLQFFDAQGDAVHKIHARPATDLTAWAALIETLRAPDQGPIELQPKPAPVALGTPGTAEELRTRWQAMTDTHQFFGLLRALNLPRLTALEQVGEDFAWRLDHSAVATLFETCAGTDLPLMAFVGNHGCIQIHTGPITNTKTMGPWFNVMDDTFHLHLRLDHITAVWGVRKPTSDGHVTSVEAFDDKGELIIQFFAQRIEGSDERLPWRDLVQNLPLFSQTNAA
ncbi:MAG TPA: ChuX/HutX family heme-like substrate-binding protein [Devosia sp.]|nr:ChuX/HutX family heme-like substrate-binding protein [Devosia sp.]